MVTDQITEALVDSPLQETFKMRRTRLLSGVMGLWPGKDELVGTTPLKSVEVQTLASSKMKVVFTTIAAVASIMGHFYLVLSTSQFQLLQYIH